MALNRIRQWSTPWRNGLMLVACGALVAALATPAYAAAAPTIAFVPKLVGIPYFDAMRQGLDNAGKKFGAKIVYEGPTTASVSGQAEMVQSLINEHVAAVGVSANSPTALEALAKKARDAGVLFYSSDSQVDGPDVALRVQQTSDSALADTVIDQIASQIGDSGDIAFVSGGPTATNLNLWIGLMKKRLAAKYPKINLVAVEYAGEDINRATQVTGQLLSAYPNLKGIVGVNSTAVPGAAQAVLRAGLTGKVMVTGITDPNSIRPFIMDGTVKSVVLWNPIDLGYITVWGVMQLLEHKPLQPENTVPGLGHQVSYTADTHTLLLGPPMVITKADVSLNF